VLDLNIINLDFFFQLQIWCYPTN